MNDNKNAIIEEQDLEESFDFDELERQLEAGLEESISELAFLEENKDKVSKLSLKYGAFSNGRYIRNIYEDAVMSHAKRVVKIQNPSLDELKLITEEDF